MEPEDPVPPDEVQASTRDHWWTTGPYLKNTFNHPVKVLLEPGDTVLLQEVGAKELVYYEAIEEEMIVTIYPGEEIWDA